MRGGYGGERRQRGVGGRQDRRRRRAVMSEINVTPFVDVMLVLLIVFMVSAPLLTVGVPLDLPQSQASRSTRTASRSPLGQRPGPGFSAEQRDQGRRSGAEAQGHHRRPSGAASTSAIYVRGDKKVDYGTMMRVMGRLSAAGYHRVALVTEVEQGGG